MRDRITMLTLGGLLLGASAATRAQTQEAPSWATCAHVQAVLEGVPTASDPDPAPRPLPYSSGYTIDHTEEAPADVLTEGVRPDYPSPAVSLDGVEYRTSESERIEAWVTLPAANESPAPLVAVVWTGVPPHTPTPTSPSETEAFWMALDQASVDLRLVVWQPDGGYVTAASAAGPPHGPGGPFGERGVNPLSRQIPHFEVSRMGPDLIFVQRRFRICRGHSSACEPLVTGYLYEVDAAAQTIHRLAHVPVEGYTGPDSCEFRQAAYAYELGFRDLNGDGIVDLTLESAARLEIASPGMGVWTLTGQRLAARSHARLDFVRAGGRLHPVEPLALDIVLTDYNGALEAFEEGRLEVAADGVARVIDALELFYSFESRGENALRCLADDPGYCAACATADVRIGYEHDPTRLLEVVVGTAVTARRLRGTLSDRQIYDMMRRLRSLLDETETCVSQPD